MAYGDNKMCKEPEEFGLYFCNVCSFDCKDMSYSIVINVIYSIIIDRIELLWLDFYYKSVLK